MIFSLRYIDREKWHIQTFSLKTIDFGRKSFSLDILIFFCKNEVQRFSIFKKNSKREGKEGEEGVGKGEEVSSTRTKMTFKTLINSQIINRAISFH